MHQFQRISFRHLNGCGLLFLLVATVTAQVQLQSIPVKHGPWLKPLRLNPAGSTDPLKIFQVWRRRNLVTLPATPEVWQAHLKWLQLHPRIARQLRNMRRVPARRERTGNLNLAGVVSDGNVVPANGLSAYQGEIAAAINPGNVQQMTASANSFLPDPQCSDISTLSLYGSQDGGQNWNYSCAPIPSVLDHTLFGSDPSLAWDANGNAYAAYMLLRNDPNIANTYDSAIVVAKSSDGGQSWTSLGVVVNHYGDPYHFDDKEMIAVDRSSGQAYSHPNRLYVIWDENNTEMIAHSDDGASWSPVVVEDAADAGDDIGGNLAIGPEGTVYAIWTRAGSAPNTPYGGDSLVFCKSSDGGQSWTAPATIAAGQLAIITDNVLIPAQDQRGINAFGSIAVDDSASAYRGSIYVVYNETPPGVNAPEPLDGIPVQPAVNIYAIQSSDGGAIWSPPLQVNDDGSDGASHFFPWCVVDPTNGILSVAWYDTRNDPGYLMRTQIYYAQSTDGGASFSPNLQVTQAASGLDNSSVDYNDENSLENFFSNPNQYGDYTQVSAAGGKVLIGWTDTRQFYPQDGVNPLGEDLVTDTLENGASLTYTISGRVTDANGQGIAGVAVAAGGASAATDGAGHYTLFGLANGDYTVSANSANFSFSPNSIAVSVQCAPVAGVDFTATATALVYSISGQVTLNGTGLEGVAVSDGTAMAITDNSGNYVLAGLPAGNYTITATDPAYSLAPGSRAVTLGGDVNGIDFSVPVYSISGRVYGTWPEGGSPCCASIGAVAGATIQAGGHATVTDANGEYTISGLPSGTYIVTAQMPGFWVNASFPPFIDDPTEYVFLTGANQVNVDFIAQAQGVYKITGNIQQNGAGVSGVKIASGNTFGISDSQGHYALFENDGTITFTPSKPGYSFSPASQTFSIPAGTPNVITGPNFSATATQGLHSISGQVTSGGAGLAGVTVAAGFSSGLSDAQGNYTISGLSDGGYMLDAVADQYVFTPVWQPATVAGSDIGGFNFSGATALFSISGTIANEAGQPLAGATVTTQQFISTTPITATTDAQGNYTLSGLPPQSEAYLVTPSDKGYSFLPFFGWSPVSNADVTGINFTAIPALTVSGRITDTSGAGVGEIYIYPDVALNTTIETDSEGNYSLTMPPGDYTLRPVDGLGLYNFDPAAARIHLDTSNLSGVNFSASQNFQISGQVLNGATGVPGASVKLFLESFSLENATYGATTTTDAHGTFYFNNVPSDIGVQLMPVLPGYGLNPPGEYLQMVYDRFYPPEIFQVVPGAVVSGTAADGQGNPIPYVMLNTQPATPTSWDIETYITDPNGVFAVSMPAGGYKITPWDGVHVFTPASANITVQPGAAVSVNFSGAVPTLAMSLGQTQYTINGSVNTLNDPVTFTSNVNQAVNISCPCSYSPMPMLSQGSGTLTFNGLANGAESQQTETIEANLLGATQTQTVTINRQSLTLAAGTSSATVNAGQIADYTVNVTAVNGYAGAVTLSCSSQANYVCSASPANPSLSANGAVAVTIAVNTAAKTNGKSKPGKHGAGWAGGFSLGGLGLALLIAWLPIGKRSGQGRRSAARRRVRRWTPALLFLAMSGCGGNPSYTPPPPTPITTTVSSSVIVYATAGSLAQTLTLTLNVQTTS